MLPLSPYLKDGFEKFEQDLLASNLPEGKYFKPKTASACNTTIEKCQCCRKATFKRVKSLIQKGANSEKAARHGYEHACDYFEILNKRILIQQRALACLKKSSAHILQRELYTMGNTKMQG